MSEALPFRPVPVPDATSAPFWAATARGELVLARCSRCGRSTHPPGPVCPHCHHTDPAFSFEPVPGSGIVRSWTVVRQASLQGFAGEVPFTLVDVELDGVEDVRLVGRLVDGPDAELRAGDRVALAFEQVGDFAVPAFTSVPR